MSLAEAAQAVVEFYSDNLRASLFSGFLTLSGFLFSVKTFIVINIKRELYDSELYRRRILDLRKVNPNLPFYGPLVRLSHLLFSSVVLSLTTAVAQLTLGFIQSPVTVAICLLLAATTIVVLAKVMFIIRSNLLQWIGFYEKLAEDESGKATARSAS